MKFSGAKLLVPTLLFFALLGGSLPACDDTLLNILVAQDPENVYYSKISGLHRDISSLGTALDGGYEVLYEKLMDQLMQSWLEFSTRFVSSPPDFAKNDPKWHDRVKDFGRRIGEIRKQIVSKKLEATHNKILELSEALIGLFDSVKLAGVNVEFFESGEVLLELEKMASRKDVPGMKSTLATFTAMIASFSSLTDENSKNTYLQLKISLGSLEKLLENSEQIDDSILEPTILRVFKGFHSLRARLLSRDWFNSEKEKK